MDFYVNWKRLALSQQLTDKPSKYFTVIFVAVKLTATKITVKYFDGLSVVAVSFTCIELYGMHK